MDTAGEIIATAAKRGLAPLGLIRKGRSRTWIDDHGWWLVNVEFQPSAGRNGCYLNVGDQHLWVVRDYLCFENVERPLGGSTFVAFDRDETACTRAMEAVVSAAVGAVERRRVAHADGTEALRRLAVGSDDLNGGIAAALLGDAEHAKRLSGQVHDADRKVADSYIGRTAAEAKEQARESVALTRQRLRLSVTDTVAW